MKLQNIKFKVYLEGKVFPSVNSISIQERMDGPVTASITIPAMPQAMALLAKTLCHIFYYDDMANDFVLIFEGELESKGFSRSADSVNAVLGFKSLTNNWEHSWKSRVDLSYFTHLTSGFLLENSMAPKRQQEVSGVTNKIYQDSYDDVDIVSPKVTVGNELWYYSTYFFADITSSLKRALLRQEVAEENIKNIFLDPTEGFLNSISTHGNPYYKIPQLALRLHDRIYIANNRFANKILTTKMVKKMFSRMADSLPSVSTISEIIRLLLDDLVYGMTEIAAPSWYENKPYNIFMFPNSNYLVPPRCNLIFGDQIEALVMNDNMMEAPTRLMATTQALPIPAGEGSSELLTIAYYAPSSEIKKNSTGDPEMKMTIEEKYKGIVPVVKQLDYLDQDFVTGQIEEATKKETQQEENKPYGTQTVTQEFGDALAKIKTLPVNAMAKVGAERMFIESRLASRSMSISTPYNPYRVVGFQVAVFDKNMPAIIGTLAARSVSISADGIAKENLNIINTYTAWDRDEQLNYSFVNEYPPLLPDWISEEYDVENIGVSGNLYNVIMGEKTHQKNSSIYYAIQDESTDKKAVEARDNYLALNSSATYQQKYDSYLQLMSNILYLIKNRYQNLEQEYRHPFIDKLNYRNLVKESDFWKFLLRGGSSPSYTGNYYRTFTRVNVDNLKSLNEKNAENFVFSHERSIVVMDLINGL